MAKSDKFTSKVPKLEDVTLAFVGEDGTVDEEKARKVLHTLMADKAKAQDAREDATAEVTEQKSKGAELQKQLDDKHDPDSKAELEKANRKVTDAEDAAKKAEGRADRAELALEKGLTLSQAKRLVGENREELEADAEELAKDLGVEPGATKQDDDDEGEGRTAPRSRLVSGGDPNPDSSGGKPVDYEAAAADIVGNRPF